MVNNLFVWGVICFFNFGCSAEKLTVKQTEWIKQSSMIFLHQAPPNFRVITERNSLRTHAGAGLLENLLVGAIQGGALTPEELGENVRSEGAIKDPATGVQRLLMENFQQRIQPAYIKEMTEVQDVDDLSGIRDKTQSDVAFVISTHSWGLRYYSFDTSFHHLFYVGHASLIDLNKLDYIWSAKCKYKSDAPKMHRPSLENFLDDHGALIKTELKRATDECVKQFKEQLF